MHIQIEEIFALKFNQSSRPIFNSTGEQNETVNFASFRYFAVCFDDYGANIKLK
jgi:hypothetical protein